jgi:hypothetical protein
MWARAGRIGVGGMQTTMDSELEQAIEQALTTMENETRKGMTTMDKLSDLTAFVTITLAVLCIVAAYALIVHVVAS